MNGTSRRQAVANRYSTELCNLPNLILPFVPKWAEPAWHLFVVRYPKRDALQQCLNEAGIGTLIHYPVPPHLSGAYANEGWRQSSFPVAEALAATVLSLPIGPHLSSIQIEQAVKAIKQSLHLN